MGNIQGVLGRPAFDNESLTPSRVPSPASATEPGQSSVNPRGNAERAAALAAFQSPTGKRIATTLQKNPSSRISNALDELHAAAIDPSTGPKDRATSKNELMKLLATCRHLHTEIKKHPSLASDIPKIREAQARWRDLWTSTQLSIAGAEGRERLETLLSSAAYLTPLQRSLLLKRIQKERASYEVNEFGLSNDPTFAWALHATCPALPHFTDKERSAIFNDVMNTLGDQDKLDFFRKAENYMSAFSPSECDRAADFLLSEENKQRSQDLPQRCLQQVLNRLSPQRQEMFIDHVLANMN